MRYFAIGYLAIRYGNDALPFLREHKLQAAAVLAAIVVLSYLVSRIILREKPRKVQAE
jgi:hypothetical protein